MPRYHITGADPSAPEQLSGRRGPHLMPGACRRRAAGSRLVASVLVTGLALLATGCGGAAEGGKQSAAQKIPKSAASKELNAKLPKTIKDRGSLVVAIDPSYPPMEFLDSDNKTIIGLDPDIARALGEVLGVKIEFKSLGFDGIIPGLVTHRFDMSISDMNDTKLRQKQVSFVDYLKAANGLLVAKGNPENVTDLDSLCGKTMSIHKGTNAEEIIGTQAAKCKRDGNPELKMQYFPSGAAAEQAVAAGRTAAYMDDFVAMKYIAKKQPQTYETVSGTYAAAPLGIAFPTDSEDLMNVVLAALKELHKNGTYEAILKKWSQTEVGIEPKINGAVY